nr:hypothetical protein TetV2_00014 [Oceanusvirus sp.]
MSRCYERRDREYGGGTFDAAADVCYLLCMDDERREAAIANLDRFRPCRRCVIQTNKGYLRCDKGLARDTSLCDIVDAYAAAFRHADLNGHGNVLVLEDDFFFDPEEREIVEECAGYVASFVNSREFDTYNLGKAMSICVPATTDLRHFRSLYVGTSHAVIYSAAFRAKYAERYASNPGKMCDMGLDLWWNTEGFANYAYRRAVCYQLFPMTENRRHWGTPPINLGIRILGLERSHVPGYAVLDAVGVLFVPVTVVMLVTILLVWFHGSG